VFFFIFLFSVGEAKEQERAVENILTLR